VGDAPIPGAAEIPTYVVQRTPWPIVVDGRLDDDAWSLAERTSAWRWLDTHEAPRWYTYGQMTWDDEFLYFAFYAQDPDVWATLQLRDEPVFVEEDFEIFLDPDGDEFNYYEWQINPLGTVYDVIWTRPAQTPGPPARGQHAFDLAPMLTGVEVKGTVWRRDDTDTGWTAEAALSWSGLAEIPGRFRTPPEQGDVWRIGFSRVENPRPPFWQADWTWPTHGEYNMHIGQRDAYVQFSGAVLGAEPAAYQPVPRLYLAEVGIEPRAADGGIPVGRPVRVVPRVGNRGATGTLVEARLSSPDSLVIVLDSRAEIGSVGAGVERWSEDGFLVRLSRAAEPGRNLLFQVGLRDAAGRWSGDYFFAFAAGRAWRTVFQLHEGVQHLLVQGDNIWGISRSNVWRWDGQGQVRGFYQPDDGLPRHVSMLALDGRGRVWSGGERGVAVFAGDAWHELTGEEGLPARDYQALAAGPDGSMWLATPAGLFRYGAWAEAVWVTAGGYVPGRVHALLVDMTGAAWVVGDSLLYRAGADGRRVLGAQDGLPSDRMRALAEDPDGRIWVGGVRTGGPHRDGGVGCWDGETWQVWRAADGLLEDEVIALYADRQGRIWAGHPGGGLCVYDDGTWDCWEPVSGPEGAGAGPGCGPCVGGRNGFLHDDAGRVWVVGREALACYDGRQWRTWTWRNGLFGGEAAAVIQGPDGRVYVADGRSLSVLVE